MLPVKVLFKSHKCTSFALVFLWGTEAAALLADSQPAAYLASRLATGLTTGLATGLARRSVVARSGGRPGSVSARVLVPGIFARNNKRNNSV